MSSPDLRRCGSVAAALALSLGLSGCFQPLYGTATQSGQSLAGTLSAIDVDEVVGSRNSETFTHYLRSELVYQLNGSGLPADKRYKLEMTFTSTLQTPIVDTATGRAQSATINGVVAYSLKTLDGSKTLTEGKATGSASYDRFVQRFASVRAARDAEIRLAKVLAEQIRTRLSAALVERPS